MRLNHFRHHAWSLTLFFLLCLGGSACTVVKVKPPAPQQTSVSDRTADTEATVAANPLPRLIPHPREVRWEKGDLRLNRGVVLDAPGAMLDSYLRQVFGGEGVTIAPRGSKRGMHILFRLNGTPPTTLSPAARQGYQLMVGSRCVTATAPSPAGLFYAATTLRELIGHDKRGAYLPLCAITDAPALAMRGVYLNLRSVRATPRAMQVLRDLIDALASYKINVLFVEVADNMRYAHVAFPEKARAAFTKRQVRNLVAYARARHMEVIPYFQALSHAGWILSNPANRALLENPADTGWHTAWNPLNPRMWALFKDVLTETIGVFHPHYIDLGMDEISWGPYPNTKDPSGLLLNYIQRLHKLLARYGVRMVLWHDQFLKPPDDPYDPKDVTQGWKILGRLPKDIIFDIWMYDNQPAELKREVNYFTSKGFDVLGAIYNDPGEIKRMAITMSRQPRGLGSEATYWSDAGDWASYQVSPRVPASTVLQADLAWNPRTALKDIRYDPVYEFMKMWRPSLEPRPRDLEPHPLQLEKFFNASIFTASGSWPVEAPGIAMSMACRTLAIGGMRFNLAANNDGHCNAVVVGGTPGDGLPANHVSIPVNRKAASLAFVQACGIPNNITHLRSWTGILERLRIGEYDVVYADGTHLAVPLLYRNNITNWNARVSALFTRRAFQVDAPDGKLVTFGCWQWVNPYPDKVILRVVLSASSHQGSSIALLAVDALSANVSRLIDGFDYRAGRDVTKVWRVTAQNLRTPLSFATVHSDSYQGHAALRIGLGPVGRQVRLIMDRRITVSTQERARFLTMRIFAPKMVLLGVYLGYDHWKQYRVLYIGLRPGWNTVSGAPDGFIREGGRGKFQWAKISELRLSWWFNKNIFPTRLILDDLRWTTLPPVAHKGAWYH